MFPYLHPFYSSSLSRRSVVRAASSYGTISLWKHLGVSAQLEAIAHLEVEGDWPCLFVSDAPFFFLRFSSIQGEHGTTGGQGETYSARLFASLAKDSSSPVGQSSSSSSSSSSSYGFLEKTPSIPRRESLTTDPLLLSFHRHRHSGSTFGN